MDCETMAGDPIWTIRSRGRCPECGRTDLDLGQVDWDLGGEPRCIDCCFGPPTEFWEVCDACSYWQPPQEECDMCGEPMR